MAKISTVIIPAVAQHTLVMTEPERLALLGCLRYKAKSGRGATLDYQNLIGTLEKVNNDG